MADPIAFALTEKRTLRITFAEGPYPRAKAYREGDHIKIKVSCQDLTLDEWRVRGSAIVDEQYAAKQYTASQKDVALVLERETKTFTRKADAASDGLYGMYLFGGEPEIKEKDRRYYTPDERRALAEATVATRIEEEVEREALRARLKASIAGVLDAVEKHFA